MYCVLSDRLDCAKLLIKMGCKLDQVDKAGRSALHLAAHKVRFDTWCPREYIRPLILNIRFLLTFYQEKTNCDSWL